MSSPFDLSGQVALVTGGNGGIGLGMARGLAQAGADVAVWGTDAGKNEAAAAELASFGVKVLALRCDVREPEAIDAALAETVAVMGKVDSCFANAGVGPNEGTRLLDTDLAEWRRVTSVDLDGSFLTLRAVAARMVEQGTGGSLVGISSITARFGFPGGAHYSASKAGIVQITKAFAVDLARHGIRANAVLPGTIAIERNTDFLHSERQMRGLKRVPARRWGRPDDFAGIAVYLASPASGFHTGDAITIDGGYLAF